MDIAHQELVVDLDHVSRGPRLADTKLDGGTAGHIDTGVSEVPRADFRARQIDEDTDAVSLLFRDLADAMKALEAFVDRVVGETESGHVHAGPDHGP